MTARYAHLSDDPMRAAADRISSRIAKSLAGLDPDPEVEERKVPEVVPPEVVAS
jgi:hypothetical protein